MNRDRIHSATMLGYLYRKAHFFIFTIVSFRRLDLKNLPNTQPKSPLQEKFFFQRATGVLHHHQIRTVEEHQRSPSSHQKEILSSRKVPNILNFTRIVKRIKQETALRPQAPAGRSSEPLQNNIDCKNLCKAESEIRKQSPSYGAV